MVDAVGHGVFSHFDRVRLFEVGEILPRGRAVNPLAAYLPSGGGPASVSPSIVTVYYLVSDTDRGLGLSMVHQLVEQHVLVSVRITLGIHRLGNHVSGK